MDSQKTKKKLTGSVIALIVCFAMLLGTTFAWFTDTASTSVNTIQSGTLDVALEMQKADGKWETVDEDDVLDFVKAAGHENEKILWEPGCTYNLPNLRVVNNGNLALKYKVQITGIKGDAKLNEVIEWTMKVGEEKYSTEKEYSLNKKDDFKTFTISGHMKESAGNQYQGLSIDGISITVLATQAPVESDSNGNTYDENAEYPKDLGIKWSGDTAPLTRDNDTPADVKTLADVTDNEAKTVKIDTPEMLAAFAQSVRDGNPYLKYTVSLEKDMDLENKAWAPIGTSSHPFKGTFDGKNHMISNLKITSGSNVGLFGHITLGPDNYTPGIKDLTLNNIVITANNSGAFVGNANTTTKNAGNGGALILNNLTLIGDVKIEGANVGGIIGTEWTDFQIAASNVTVDVNEGSYVKGTGVIGGVFASTPHGTVEGITSNINVIGDGKDIAAGGIVGCAGWTLTDVTCTGDVVATNVPVADNGKYQIGKIVGKEANNPYWNRYKDTSKYGSSFDGFTANNTIQIKLTNGTTLTSNGLGSDDQKGSENKVDYALSLVGAAIWSWTW